MPLSVLSICYIERGNECPLLPDLSYIKDIIYFLLANDRFGINHVVVVVVVVVIELWLLLLL